MPLPAELTTVARQAAGLLVARKERISVAESSAGGLISAALLTVPGASAYYLGGCVVYTVVAAKELLERPVMIPADVRGASAPFAEFLSRAVSARLRTDWGVSETGATGPDGNRYGDPAGHAYVGVAGPGGNVATRNVLTGSADREENMIAFAVAAISLLVENLGG